METMCEASISWDKPKRFRHVCPLLVETPDGLRCSVNTADVRPFWRRAFALYGGALLALYLTAAISFFIFLRIVGYPVNIFHTIWPPAWHHLREARGNFFFNKATKAFASGHPSEGVLYLSNAYTFDPANYSAGLMLAKNIQLGQPNLSDSIYQQLLVDHPAQRTATAQEWFRALLARGNYPAIQQLALLQVIDDAPHASVWMRALVLACRQTRNDAPLRALRASTHPAAQPWRMLIDVELALNSGHTDAARSVLTQVWGPAPAYTVFYQVQNLIALNDPFRALDLLNIYGRRLDDEARVTLQLEAFARLGSQRLLQRQTDALLAQAVNFPTVKILAAHLIRHPDSALLDQVYAKFMAAKYPVDNDSAGIYLSLYCAAGVAQDWGKAHAITGVLRQSTGGSFVMLGLMESFFRGDGGQTRVSVFLPAMPMPLEVTYALLERYPGSVYVAPTAHAAR
ncbi:MAG: hypothetical protein JSS11_14265 [Verrucomicrobia bacterium]|nr:hypothetical protein [Verrucomicrobiota bacterium]